MSESLREILAEQLPRLYRLAFFTTGSHDAAVARLEGFGVRHGSSLTISPDAAIGHLARDLEAFMAARESVHQDDAFETLDEVLRDDLSFPVDATTPGIDGELGRVPGLLVELKRTCLARTLACLTAHRRLAFALVHVMGMSVDDAAAVMETSISAFRVRLVRATKTLARYLGPMCGHVDSGNPCTCTGRLETALRKRFIGPERLRSLPVLPDDSRHSSAAAVYRTLPSALMPHEAAAVLASMLVPTPMDEPTDRVESARGPDLPHHHS